MGHLSRCTYHDTTWIPTFLSTLEFSEPQHTSFLGWSQNTWRYLDPLILNIFSFGVGSVEAGGGGRPTATA